MTKKTIAFLASNGVDEKILSAFQRFLSNERKDLVVKIVSTEKALIQTWSGSDWGYSMAVSQKVDNALSADYDVLILTGSQKSIDKLSSNPHSNRFVEGFHGAKKPMIAINEGVEFLNGTIGMSDEDHIMRLQSHDFNEAMVSEILDFIDKHDLELSIAA